MWSHFRHFFVDCIHRLWALKAGGTSYDGVAFLAVEGLQEVQSAADLAAAQPPRFLGELMALPGMPPVPVILIRDVTTIDRLDVPAPGTAPTNRSNPSTDPISKATRTASRASWRCMWTARPSGSISGGGTCCTKAECWDAAISIPR